jgi:hypothetical protein
MPDNKPEPDQTKNIWLNKFELPLTMIKTASVIEVIQNIKYNKYIYGIYLPLHGEDGISGRAFYPSPEKNRWAPAGYKISKKEWIKLIKEIAQYKAVILTCPYLRSIEKLKEYMDYGISEIKVDEYWSELDSVRDKIKISRSIVGNHNPPDEIDPRFHEIVIPFKRGLDIEWLEKTSEKFELTAIINHFCLVKCPAQKYKDSSQEKIKKGYIKDYRRPFSQFCFNYNDTCSSMLPRKAVIKLSKYFTKLKLVDRITEPNFYINYLNHYIYNESFSFNNFETERGRKFAEKMHKMLKDKELHFNSSNMSTLNCKFECANCLKKCYSVSDWRHEGWANSAVWQ